ncbi:MAG TPA: hypothetical protein VHA37_01745 [Candidatus Saccharimonadales bacterium]|nr:hypothetical protein [Candidatus Saccharimonadales bacterium]
MGLNLLPDWTERLTLQQQAVLILALRGPDGFAKRHAVKNVLKFYRACLLRDASSGRLLGMGEHNSLMSMAALHQDVWNDCLRQFQEIEDELPLHFYTHLMHGAQILSYKHPDRYVRARWRQFYLQCCDYLHVLPEPEDVMDQRLNDFGRIDHAAEPAQ